MVGKTGKFLGQSYQYIKRHAGRANLTPVQGCLQVMSDVEDVLNLILQGRTEEAAEAQASA